MVPYIENPEPFLIRFNEVAAHAQKRAFMTVGVEIQRDELEIIDQYLEELSKIKSDFVSRNLENESNLIFCFESSISIIKSEIQMLIHIKEDKMNDAWNSLVLAQNIYGSVVRNYPFNTESLNGYFYRLNEYEKLLFPKQSFTSIGGIVKKSKCSICDKDYNDCDHIKGKVYMGTMCSRIITEVDLEEISTVENPADKRCRIISYKFDGEDIDVMTLRIKSTSANIT